MEMLFIAVGLVGYWFQQNVDLLHAYKFVLLIHHYVLAALERFLYLSSGHQ